MQYIFTVSTSDFFAWPINVPDNSRVVSHEETGICVQIKNTALRPMLIAPSSREHSDCLDLFLTLRSVFAYLRNKEQGMIDIYLNAAQITRHVGEYGTLPYESHILIVLRTLQHYIMFHPALANNMPKSSDPIPFDHSPELKESYEVFHIANHFYDYRRREFYQPCGYIDKIPQLVSLIYLPLDQPLTSAIPKIRLLLKSVKPQDCKGLRVNCSLFLDSVAPQVDLRFITPETLNTMEVLHMSPRQYDEWCKHSLLTPEKSKNRREALFRSTQDFRFAPYPEDYHWKCVIKNVSCKFIISPYADWHFLLANSSALDYAYAHGVSDNAMKEISDCEDRNIFPRRAETWGRMDPLTVRIPPLFKMTMSVVNERVVHTQEKAIERRVRLNPPCDAFMASIGILWDFQLKQWSTKAYNRIALRNNNIINADHIDKCFDGFALESAKKLSLAAPPCPICDEQSNRLLETCGHVYCNQCLDLLFATNNTDSERCPECRVSFWKENIVELKVMKPQRKRSKEFAFARQAALRAFIPESKGPIQQDTDHILLITPLDASIDVLQSWLPGIHMISLETLGERTPKSPRFSKLIMVTPYIPGVIHLERLHKILQTWTTLEFELHTIALQNGSQTEDTTLISSLTKSYGVVS
jgi:hypothetical protein